MMIRHVLLIAAGSAVLAACSSPQGNLPPIQKMEQTVYRLGAGDEVRVAVFGLDALTNTYVVGDAGTISLPLINELPVRGKPTNAIDTAIATLQRERHVVRNPSVSEQMMTYRPFFILRPVQSPGQYLQIGRARRRER